jgi:hypothetical protein
LLLDVARWAVLVDTLSAVPDETLAFFAARSATSTNDMRSSWAFNLLALALDLEVTCWALKFETLSIHERETFWAGRGNADAVDHLLVCLAGNSVAGVTNTDLSWSADDGLADSSNILLTNWANHVVAWGDDGGLSDNVLDTFITNSSESSWAGDSDDRQSSSDTYVSLWLELSWALGDTLSVHELEESFRAAELALGSRHSGGVLWSELDFPSDGLPFVLLVTLVHDGSRLGGLGLASGIEGSVGVHLLGLLLPGLLGGPDSLQRTSSIETRGEDGG